MQLQALLVRHRRAVALVVLVGATISLTYSLVRWQGTAGIDPALRPLGVVYSTAALSVVAAEAVIRPRRGALSNSMLLLAVILMILSSLSPS